MKKSIIIRTILSTLCLVAMFSVASFAVGWVNDGGGDWMYVDANNMYLTDTIKSSGNEKFYLDMNGVMVRDYLLEDYNDSIYYFDDSGKMVVNTWVAVDPMQVENQMDNAPTIYLYYFGANGKAYKAGGSGLVRKTIDGKKYLFNENGQMLSGWINEDGETYDEYNTEEDPFVGYCYYAGDETDGVLREGWTAYEDGSVEDRYYMRQTLWFYFRRNDNKKVQSESADEIRKLVVNGNTYAFDDNGVMIEGWDSDWADPQNDDLSINTKKYFKEDGDDVGRMTKREWVFAVPSMKQNLDDHDQETERWFYATGGGDVVKGIVRKINSSFYVFNEHGIMRTGLCIIDKATKRYVDCIDAEKTDGKDFIISRHYISVDKTSSARVFEIFDDNTQAIYYFDDDEESSEYGRRRPGEHKVAFGDDDYIFMSNTQGEYEGIKKNKYYQAGIRLTAEPDLSYGLVFLGYTRDKYGSAIDEIPQYYNSTHPYAQDDVNHDNIKTDYVVIKPSAENWLRYGVLPVFAVVDKSGQKMKQSYKVKKDKSNRYWAIGPNASLICIYEVPVKYKGGTWYFKSEKLVGNRSRQAWIEFNENDVYGKTCRTDRTNPGEYALTLDETYTLNFRFAD